MNVRTGLVIASLLAVAGCASMSPGGGRTLGPGSCTSQNCPDITVSVASCQVSVDLDPMDVARGNHDVNMVWKLDLWSRMTGYAFDDPAIVVKTPPPPPNEFRITPGMYTVTVHNRNSANKTYTYAVKVKRWGTACNPSDPTIINQG